MKNGWSYLVVLISLWGILFAPALFAQEEDSIEYVPEHTLAFKNKIYDAQIHTLNMHRSGSSIGLPIVGLGSGERMEVSFDDFSMKSDEINYTVIHCNADWQPTQLEYFQYVSGTEEGYITDYTYSTAFNQQYIQYQLTLPNEEIQFKKSGNYLLLIYRNGDQAQLIATHRFFVTENRVAVRTKIHPAFDPADRFKKHEIDFIINHEKYPIINPSKSIHVRLLQNYRWDNAITDLKPLFIANNELTYNHDGPNTFWAGNEQRFVDLRNLSIASENIDGFINRPDTTHVFIEPQLRRRIHKQGSLQGTLYGGRIIGSKSFNHTSSSDIDYCMVYFYLDEPNENPNGDYYVFGEVSNYELDDRYKMEYNPAKKRYERKLYLKQGIYNWLFLYSENGVNGAVKNIEGSFSDTENTYSLLIYHRDITSDYDRLIHFSSAYFPSAVNQFNFNSSNGND